MPQIRFEITSFVEEWNVHPIRRQDNRGHVHSGKPVVLSRLPKEPHAINCAVEYDSSAFGELLRIVEADKVDLDAYLTLEMEELCDKIMKDFQKPVGPEDMHNPLLHDYLFLQQKLKAHDAAQATPKLVGVTRADGGWPEFEAMIREANIDIMGIIASYTATNVSDSSDYTCIE